MMHAFVHTLRSKYNVVFLKDFSEYYSASDISEIFNDLSSLKREKFEDNDRIVFFDPTIGNADYYKFLNNQLIDLDIPDYFVFFITDSVHKNLITYNKSADSIKLPFFKEITEYSALGSVYETGCINPWINLEIGNNGKLNVCCEHIADDLPHVSTISFEEFYKVYASNIRNQFLNGETPPGCKKCINAEQVGGKSKRIRDQYVYRDKKYKVNWLKPEFNKDIVSLDFKVGNLCNLACRICNHRNSSLWAEELNVKKSINESTWIYTETDAKIDYVSELNLEYLQITGGEPLLNKLHIRLLNNLIKSGKSKKINLHYNSNGTVFPEFLLPIWEQFKTVEISLSIDNLYDKFNYERFGLVKWDVVENNILRFLELRDKIILNVFSTVTVFNIMDLKNIFDYFHNKNIPIVFNELINPRIYNIMWLPESIKKHINNILIEQNLNNKSFIDAVLKITNLMMSGGIPDQFENFIKTTKEIDERRNQHFSEIYPELTFLLEKNYG